MSVLEPALAQKFIDKTARHLEYNINIMNDKGIIIASKDESRIGNFHEVAFKMLEGTRDTGVVTEPGKFLGTKPGVNLFIDYKNKHVGVICVTGNPENVHAFANLVKTSMEAMLEYELQMDTERRRKDKTEQFLYYMLFDEDTDLGVAENMARKIDLDLRQSRLCLIIPRVEAIPQKAILTAISQADGASSHDLVCLARNDNLIILKAMGADFNEASKSLIPRITEYFDSIKAHLPETVPAKELELFVGTLQDQLANYRTSYLHAQEMGLHLKGEKGVHFFQDHLLDYLRGLVTIRTYHEIFNAYSALFTEEESKQLVEIAEALRNNNYNIVYSSKDLYIHRNTMIFRLNKIKETLNIDPVANAKDREFLTELAYYFKNRR